MIKNFNKKDFFNVSNSGKAQSIRWKYKEDGFLFVTRLKPYIRNVVKKSGKIQLRVWGFVTCNNRNIIQV